MKPKIFFEDDDLLILNKPAGITVNKSDTTIHEVTVQDFTEKYLSIEPIAKNENEEMTLQVNAKDMGVYQDPFSYFADVIHKKISVQHHGLYALPNNVIVVRILEAARESANTGKTVMLKK